MVSRETKKLENEMAKIIAISNQKGGVGKSTTAINLSSILASFDKKVLIIDMDPQGNTTSGLGINKNELENTIYELLILDINIKDIIIKNKYKNLDIIPSNVDLAAAEVELQPIKDREYILKNKVSIIEKEYDYIIIDCPPSLGMLTINSITFAKSVLIPIQCEYYALEGLSQLLNTINLIKEVLNENLEIEGIVFTMYDSRNRLSQEVIENVKSGLPDTYIFETIIPRNVRVAEAPSFGQPINIYDSNCSGAKSYIELSKELIKKEV